VAATPGRAGDAAGLPVLATTSPPGQNGNGNGHEAASNGHERPTNVGAVLGRRPDIPYVSPLRGGVLPAGGPLEQRSQVAVVASAAGLPAIDPAEPVATYPDEGPDSAGPERDLEPALPDEARERAATEAAAPTAPMEAGGSSSTLHVRFGGAPAARLVLAMETFRQLVRERPGETRVVVHVPAPGGSALPMELRTPVAYDADLLAEVRRRLGEGIVDLQLT
jgi:hypothetical protein